MQKKHVLEIPQKIIISNLGNRNKSNMAAMSNFQVTNNTSKIKSAASNYPEYMYSTYL